MYEAARDKKGTDRNRRGFGRQARDQKWDAVLILRAAGWSLTRIARAGLPQRSSVHQHCLIDPVFREKYRTASPPDPKANRWTNTEKAFVRENYGRMTAPDIARHLHRTKVAVKRLIADARRLDASAFPVFAPYWRDDEEAFLRANAGHMNTANMALFLKDRTRRAIYQHMVHLGLPARRTTRKLIKPRDIYGLIASAVPPKLPRHVRDDVIGEMSVAVLEGVFGIHEIKNQTAGYLSAYWRQHPTKYGPVSLDAPAYGDDDKTPLIERIANDQTIW